MEEKMLVKTIQFLLLILKKTKTFYCLEYNTVQTSFLVSSLKYAVGAKCFVSVSSVDIV